MAIDTDVCVIGAGSGGLSVAYGASQMGARVVLVEAGLMGGDCLNYGCVPSKALLAAGKAAHGQATSGRFGVAPVAPEVDFASVNDHVRGVIDAIAPVDSQERYEGLGVHVLRGHARFVSPEELQVGDERVRARRFVIATGSAPALPPIEGLDHVHYVTNETLFELREKPRHLMIIGGGPVGAEMAQAHARLGSEVTLVAGGGLLSKEDPELVEIVRAQLDREGVRIITGQRAASVSAQDEGLIVVTDDGARLEGSHLLLAVGRAPNVEGLGLEAAGVDYDKAGVHVGPHLRTTNRRIYAVGDAAGGPNFTHVASYHASVVVRQVVLGLAARVAGAHVPRVTYTDPELAHVGLTEEEARERHGPRLQVARFTYAENDRARAERREEGMIKVMVARGRPVGASIVGAGAGDLVTPWSLAIANNLKMSSMTRMIAPYPTLSELNTRVVGAYFSPKLFDSVLLKRIVRLVQRFLP